jgi:acyl carrier protein
MERSEIIEKLKQVVQPYVKNQVAFENLTESTDFIRDLKINSANLVDVVLDIEEVFDITIDNEAMEKMLDVQSTLAIISSKLAEK